jgi:hypothetical protein
LAGRDNPVGANKPTAALGRAPPLVFLRRWSQLTPARQAVFAFAAVVNHLRKNRAGLAPGTEFGFPCENVRM